MTPTPRGTIVVRDGRIVDASEGMLAMLALERDELVGRDFSVILVPEERERVVDRYRRRARGEPVPSEYETGIIAKTGLRRTVRVSVTADERDLVIDIEDISETVARRERLAALARLGTSLQVERSEEVILRRVREEILEIGLSSCLMRRDGNRATVTMLGAPPGVLAAVEDRLGRSPVGVSGPWLPMHEAAWIDGGAFTDDASLGIGEFLGGELGDFARGVAHQANLVRAGLVRLDVAGEAAHLLIMFGEWLRDEDMPALHLFGSQVSAALTGARIIGDLSRRNAELAALNRLAAVARTAPDLGSLFRAGLAEISRLFDCDGAIAYLLERDRSTLVLEEVFSARQSGGEAFRAQHARLARTGSSLLWKTVDTGEPQVVSGEDYRGPMMALVREHGTRCIVAIPIVARSAVVGVFAAVFDRPYSFGQRELELLQAMGSHFGAAVESQQLLSDLRERIDELTLVHEVGRALVESLELDQVFEAAAQNLARSVDAAKAFVAVTDGSRRRLRAFASYGDPAQHGRRFTVPAGTPLAVDVLEGQKTLVIEDVGSWNVVQTDLLDSVEGRACIAVPLVVRGTTIGLATVVETRPRRFRQAEIERATSIANQIAVAIDNARLYDDLRRSYQALARTQAQLVERERLAAIGELAAVVAHEIRNPLTVIFNSLGSIKRLVKPEGNAKLLLDIVGEESERLNRIVGDLLEYARPVVLDLRGGSVVRVVDEAVRTAMAASSGVRLEREVDPDLPEVRMDSRLLRQAVLNVALNAVQAMTQGGRLGVRVSVERAGPAPAARIEISDTGAGIPGEVRARIFEPFFTTKSTGTGLGLAVVKRIVESHRGHVSVTSEPGAGSTFTIRLPLEQAPVEALQALP